MKGSEIRRKFLEYFGSKGHKIIKSSPLVPQGDPTLLFVNAGMVQFKNVFLGQEDIGTKRAATSQKCLRVSGKHNDFDQVGRTPRHHTFFEMLGNFSFGDYFKRDAIAFAWEFVTGVLGISPDLLTATVFEEDDEAEKLWAEISTLPPERILRMGAADNFWAMGETGPCGPCTELHVDLKPGEPGGLKEDPERFMEIWNLVFMQYDRSADGKMKPLPAPSVDTGAGLERIAAVMQKVPTNFDTDLFEPIRNKIAKISGKTYGEDPDATVSMRVICDHARALTFLIGDAVLPSNMGRGYVLRRVMRRAARHGVLLGIHEPFLFEIVDSVVETMRDAYPELLERKSYIRKVVKNEEERFLRTLENGLRLLKAETERIMALGPAAKFAQPPCTLCMMKEGVFDKVTANGGKVLSGEFAFKLYDTFGFPLDLTQDIGRSEGFTVDVEGFNAALERQREKSSKGGKFDAEAGLGAALGELAAEGVTTKFVGYDAVESVAEIKGIVKDGELVAEVHAGGEIEFVTDRTPFYAEKGGQVGDAGFAFADRLEIRILDAQPAGESLIAHRAKVERGTLRIGDHVTIQVDAERRARIRKNHTATHLLHHALRKVLGEDAKQAGSLVTPDRLRFDFSHFSAMTEEELREVERIANEMVLQNIPVDTSVKPYEEAVKSGAIALFGEKYGNEVRVVGTGPSVEFCGGTHVAATGEIGTILIASESSVAAGVRRIEAVTGPAAYGKIRASLDAEKNLALLFKIPPEQLEERVKAAFDQIRGLEKEVDKLQERLSASENKGLIERVREVNGVKLLAAVAKAANPNDLRLQAARLRDQLGSGIVVLGAEFEGKASLCVMVSPDLTKRYQAGKIIGPLAKIVGGGGGGKPDMAQAGGPDPSKLAEAMEAAAELI